MDEKTVSRLYSDRNIGRFCNEKDQQMLKELDSIVEHTAPRLPYHNIKHMRDVSDICQKHSFMEGMTYKQTIRLAKAGKLHDIFYIPGKDYNEDMAAEMSRYILKYLGDGPGEIDRTCRLILSTKYPTNPGTTEEMIIRDADMDNVGRDDFFVCSEMLRIEQGIDKDTWYREIQPRFLDNVRFYTLTANTVRGPGLRKNKERLRQWIESSDKINYMGWVI